MRSTHFQRSHALASLAAAVLAACTPAPAIQAQVLVLNNGPFITGPGQGFGGADVSQTQSGIVVGLGNSELVSPPNGPLRIADDFTLTGGGARGTQLTTLVWYGFQTQTANFNTDNPFTGAFVTLYDGSPLAGGHPFAGDFTTNRLLSGTWSGVYRVSSSASQLLNPNRPVMALTLDMSWLPRLPDGHYYLAVSLANESSPASGLFSVPVTPQRAGTDNAEQFFNGAWLSTPIDFPFLLYSACPADFNGSGTVTVQDIFDFLGAYFTSDPAADFNGVGGVTVQDIFDYLGAYFSACP